ncbi:TPA: hypothetical protein DD617_00155 [Candidatus Uhrbacteria bacterium]|nr:hypothetical protein [Candidatus Uhrbacteria bacterium]
MTKNQKLLRESLDTAPQPSGAYGIKNLGEKPRKEGETWLIVMNHHSTEPRGVDDTDQAFLPELLVVREKPIDSPHARHLLGS